MTSPVSDAIHAIAGRAFFFFFSKDFSTLHMLYYTRFVKSIYFSIYQGKGQMCSTKRPYFHSTGTEFARAIVKEFIRIGRIRTSHKIFDGNASAFNPHDLQNYSLR